MSIPRPGNETSPDAQARAAGYRRIAGVDEAGRGPWAGPVVASAVVLRRSRVAARIDDSKRLTPRQREAACVAILAAADVGIGIVPAPEIDQRHIHRATLLAMRLAIDNLAATPDFVLVDGLHAPAVPVPCRAIVRGDQASYVVACASIIAKVVRDGLMRFYHRLLPGYDFHEHKGYGTPAHAAALARYGPCVLHRFSFEPVRRLLAEDARGADRLPLIAEPSDALLAASAETDA